LKEYFLFLRFREKMSLAADPRHWADAIGATMVGRESFLPNHHLNLDSPFRQFTTPAESALSLQPESFLPRMLSNPKLLLHRALRMNDYKLAEKIHTDYYHSDQHLDDLLYPVVMGHATISCNSRYEQEENYFRTSKKNLLSSTHGAEGGGGTRLPLRPRKTAGTTTSSMARKG
ncbi:unnamed protein product, partial [Amoebophrya sp. A120]